MSSKIDTQRAQEKRRRARRFQHDGNYRKAVEAQVELINEQGGYAQERAEDMHLLGLYLFQLGDIPSASKVLEMVYQFEPQDADVAKNYAICELKLGRVERALAILKACVDQHPDNFEIRDVLAHAAGQSGNLALASEHGEIALALKHEAVVKDKAEAKLRDCELKPFNPVARSQNVISFSLWGSQAKYLDGAIHNARLAPDIYPAWQCRFYVDDSVPAMIIEKLRGLDAQIVIMPRARYAFEGLFWRFLVADDPQVSRFLVRDCDALVNIRERAAVDLWCQSDKCFHVMRDFYSHTELILAGLWGGANGGLPNMAKLIEQFVATLQLRTRIIDQVFLRECVWPLIYQDVLIHDSQFESSGSKDFPPLAVLPPGRHVGQDQSIYS